MNGVRVIDISPSWVADTIKQQVPCQRCPAHFSDVAADLARCSEPLFRNTRNTCVTSPRAGLRASGASPELVEPRSPCGVAIPEDRGLPERLLGFEAAAGAEGHAGPPVGDLQQIVCTHGAAPEALLPGQKELVPTLNSLARERLAGIELPHDEPEHSKEGL